MKYLVLTAVLCVALLTMTGCLRAPVIPPLGVIYSDVKAPLDVDANNTVIGGATTKKPGMASCINVLGLVSVGDASVKAAADDGAITKIDHVDYEFMCVLFVYSKYTTIVYGQ